jgi:hypothetical protein
MDMFTGESTENYANLEITPIPGLRYGADSSLWRAALPSITPDWYESPSIPGGVGGAWPAKPASNPICQDVRSCKSAMA